jgi:hypothetical protein
MYYWVPTRKNNQEMNNSMNRVISIVVLLSLLCANLVGCDTQEAQRERHKYLISKTNYAGAMCFDSELGPGFYLLTLYLKGEYIDCVFVYSESESTGYGDDVIVAWPTEDTKRVLFNLNFVITYEKIDLEPYSFEYPITMEDVVERWEDVYSFFDAFTESQLRYIWNPEDADF